MRRVLCALTSTIALVGCASAGKNHDNVVIDSNDQPPPSASAGQIIIDVDGTH